MKKILWFNIMYYNMIGILNIKKNHLLKKVETYVKE